ncbi:MAG: hypothetical protein EBZ51_08560 [Synechococcaceae bacterium WB9_2_112]|nr:hypothetical protein [Synechococcaceae bacterium WB9_2_112]
MFTPTCKPTPIPGIYEHTSGAMIRRTVAEVVATLYPEQPIRQPNGNIRRAFARMARQRAAGGPVERFSGGNDPISRTTAHLACLDVWDEAQIIAAPLHLADHRARVATTADLLLRFPDNALGVALLITEAQPTTIPEPWLAALGGALVMASDQLRSVIARPLLIWASPLGVTSTEHDPDACTVPWVTGLETVVWLDALRNGSTCFPKAESAA